MFLALKAEVHPMGDDFSAALAGSSRGVLSAPLVHRRIVEIATPTPRLDWT